MEIIVKGIHLKVTTAIHDHAVKKLEKCEKFFNNIQKILVELEVLKIKNKDSAQVCKVTVYASGAIIRANESDPDMYVAIDRVVDKVEKQLRKHHDKLKNRKSGKKLSTVLQEKLGGVFGSSNSIKKEKYRMDKPMDPMEALLQIRAAKQPFYIFQNKITKEVNVIYKRENGTFGLLVEDNDRQKSDRARQYWKKMISMEHGNGGPKITKTLLIHKSPLEAQEAVEKMEKGKFDFFAFRDKLNEEIQVVYKKSKKMTVLQPVA